MEIDRYYNEDCLDTMKRMQDDFIDLIVTSPPYDNLREYNGFSFDFENISKELFRVLKNGCVMVWVIGDSVIDGSETGTSFKQALKFMDIGFKLHDTMIYEKNSSTFPATIDSKRYTQIFEYMFVFVKGKIRNDIHLLADKPNKYAGTVNWGKLASYKEEGYVENKKEKIEVVPEYSLRNNIWRYVTSFNEGTGHHPAVFPDKLAEDHILSWSNKNDLVYDPFLGSGTTAKNAISNNRHWIGSEISAEYCKIIDNRIRNVQTYLI